MERKEDLNKSATNTTKQTFSINCGSNDGYKATAARMRAPGAGDDSPVLTR